MKARVPPLPDPPERHPYVRVKVLDTVRVLRVPSVLTVAKIAKALDAEQVEQFARLMVSIDRGTSLRSMFDGAEDMFALTGALVGIAWADPELELETLRPEVWDAASATAFGAGVFGELDEAGWRFSQIAACALAVTAEIVQSAKLEQEVAERANFFGQLMGLPKPTSSPPEPSSSVDSAASES